jgi:branched-chain amino acid transport system permease protein
LTNGILLALLAIIGPAINLRAVFLNASPNLFEILTFGMGTAGAFIFPVISAITSLVGAVYLLLPENVRTPTTTGVMALIFMALFSGIFRVAMINLGSVLSFIAKSLFSQTGLTVFGAIFFFAIVAGWNRFWGLRRQGYQDQYDNLTTKKQGNLRIIGLIAIAVFALILPQISGPFIAQVIVIISLYILMGLGLNITLGFAGLLDLGFVAFYAVGAYTVGLLTSYGPFGLQHIPFWVAVPIAVLVAMMFGAFLGLPVLGVRGDYLAIATMGFGEIIRLFAGSDFLSPFFGGPQGVIGIQKPCIGTLGEFLAVDTPRVCNGIELGRPQDIYYLAVVAALIIAFVAWRLRESRLGRAWMAIREDEDVAEALGVNLVQTKLLAYILGAAFAGLGGAIFTVLIGSIFATSMQLLVSINVVALIIVGGMGSIPGVIVGAIALIGLPELLREVSEFRYLIYGVVLIIMMQLKPEGLWPTQAAKRELHHSDNLTVKVE